ncbi:conserved hypothetical protein [Hyella patelloides LEGE 07179]|uniref:DUF6194 domain-containing protein n=1 Tax=Hyella patelloides LEGE 07179 TaxID=945734 RepID=A0A563VS74_9CYAN|nr:DUF6194 family protein [Hyella patelloides]VEP14263.1 conserved hypothetical protein [Hyella patelloides LEGE 07179]
MKNAINQSTIETYLLKTYEHINPVNSWGERSYFVNPKMKLKRGSYFATVKSKDGENDKASYLNRPGVFRLNIGLTPEKYEEMFGLRPLRPVKSGVVEGNFDFQALNIFIPHPVYGWCGWIAINNPDEDNFEKSKEYLDVAYKKAFKATMKKLKTT